jgi:hypothetical protein
MNAQPQRGSFLAILRTIPRALPLLGKTFRGAYIAVLAMCAGTNGLYPTHQFHTPIHPEDGGGKRQKDGRREMVGGRWGKPGARGPSPESRVPKPGRLAVEASGVTRNARRASKLRGPCPEFAHDRRREGMLY